MGVGEWYHCFTRGVDKRRTFQSTTDYRRFQQVLYLCNSDIAVHRSDLQHLSHADIFSYPRGKPLVELGAYCIMPNHFHLLIQEIVEGGVARFMQKVGTAYGMYFNIKNKRIGNLFVKPFRSKHVDDDAYLRHVAQYIHLNPVELFDPTWKTATQKNITRLESKLRGYEFSSLAEYLSLDRPEKSLLGAEAKDVLSDGLPELNNVITEAAEYYREIGMAT